MSFCKVNEIPLCQILMFPRAIAFQKNILDLVGVGLAPTPAGRPPGYAPTQKHYLNIYSHGLQMVLPE
jgi:hypothetical protein